MIIIMSLKTTVYAFELISRLATLVTIELIKYVWLCKNKNWTNININGYLNFKFVCKNRIIW